MSEATDSTPAPQTPNPDLRSLDRLVGTWDLSEEASGTVRYEWMDGGHFLIQHVEIASGSEEGKGIEMIGHWRPYEQEPDPKIRSRFYGNDGSTLDYVYEMDGDTLTIWGGDVGSPAYFRGDFSADGRVLAGGWVYPGGGYRTTATRRS